MEGVFKLIIYVIIFIVWSVAQAKKKKRWDEKIPDFPAKPEYKKPPEHNVPQREGLQQQQPQPTRKTHNPNWKMDEASLAYQRKLEMRKKRLHSVEPTINLEPKREDPPIEKKYIEPIVIENAYQPTEIKLPALSIPLVTKTATVEKKTYYHLKSSIKEGILWSIILGQPRSKQQNRKIL